MKRCPFLFNSMSPFRRKKVYGGVSEGRALEMRHHGFSCSSLYTVTPEQAQENLLIKNWLNMRSGELREQELAQGSQQRFPSSSHVVNKRKEAQIPWQVVL